MRYRVSVIATVLNEAAALPGLLDSLCQQARLPDEVVIADGGSTDGSLTVLDTYSDRLPLRVVHVPGANIAQGRNAAIAAATGDIIAVTDAGVRLHPGWLDALAAPFEAEAQEQADLDALREVVSARYPAFPWQVEPLQVVAGFFQPDPHGVFETALGATTLPDLEDIDPLRFLPSSRSLAFRKAAWEAAGRYPEWLDYCEDLLFDFALRRVAGRKRWLFNPNALVYFRPRSTPRAFFRQYYRYARGDGKADLWRKRHAIRYATYLVALPLLLLLGRKRPLPAAGLLLASALAYCAAPYRRLWPRLPSLSPADRLRAIAWVPLIRAIGDVAKMLGYPVGVWWRWRRR